MKMIPLTQGMEAKVDDEDYPTLSLFKWCASKGSKNKTYYAARGIKPNGVPKRIYMHRAIAQALPDEIVDHDNHDTLDNQRHNLRVGTQALNLLNRKPNEGHNYRGVSFYAPTQQWVAHYKRIHIGYFDREDDAAQAFNAVAFKDNPDWNSLNDIPGLGKVTTYPETYKPKHRRNKFRGVRRRGRNSWEAYIAVNNNRYVIGYYPDEIPAAQAYNLECFRVGCPKRANVLPDI